jgi:hypothetical protein
MTDALGRTLEHRVIILEKQVENLEETNIMLEAMKDWLVADFPRRARSATVRAHKAFGLSPC